MTQEKASILIQVLSQDPEKAQRLYAMAPEQAAAELHAMGCGVTTDDLKDWGEALEQYQKTSGDELSEEQMEGVAGGVLMTGLIGLKPRIPVSILPIMPIRWKR